MRREDDTQGRSSLMTIGRRWLVMGTAIALLFGCGGGGGVGVGGTGSFASFAAGPVDGFGSVIVNGVRFDDSGARIENEDGERMGNDDLRLGMTVVVEGDQIVLGVGTALATSNASLIRYASELRGLVESVDAASGTIMVMGQQIVVDPRTALDGLPGGLGALRVGDPIEVFGLVDAQGSTYRATRVDFGYSPNGLRLRGIVSRLDPVAKEFRIGGSVFSYDGAASVPVNLADGDLVRLRLQASKDAAGRWVVMSFKAGTSPLPDADDAKIEGLITAYASPTEFSVNGQPVDATGAEFKDGRAGLAVGVRVKVEGPVRNGVLRAEEVEIESEDEQEAEKLEFEGEITSVNTATGTFVLRAGSRSFTIGTSRNDLRYDDGNASDLKVGAEVEVKAVLSADGTAIEATRIKFDD